MKATRRREKKIEKDENGIKDKIVNKILSFWYC